MFAVERHEKKDRDKQIERSKSSNYHCCCCCCLDVALFIPGQGGQEYMSNAFTSGRIHSMQRTLCFVSVPSSVLSHFPPFFFAFGFTVKNGSILGFFSFHDPTVCTMDGEVLLGVGAAAQTNRLFRSAIESAARDVCTCRICQERTGGFKYRGERASAKLT